MTRIKRVALLFILPVLLVNPLRANDAIQAGVLAFGTVNWELDVVQHHGLDRKHNIALKITPFSSNQAAQIAFRKKQVDMIVSDWIWVSRERYKGEDFSFIPYSAALGAVMVPPESKVQNLKDLSKLRVGIAGGPYDKSWLLLRAWSQKQYGFDPLDTFDAQYAAPPLLNGQIGHGHLDAVLNYWHYCARLEAQNYRRLIEIRDIGKDLIGHPLPPMIGYIFRETWAQNGIAAKFNAAIREARALLLHNDTEWERLRPLMKVKDEAAFYTLRDRYRAGIPEHWGDTERSTAKKLFQVFATLGGENLTGKHQKLADGTFWSSVRF